MGNENQLCFKKHSCYSNGKMRSQDLRGTQRHKTVREETDHSQLLAIRERLLAVGQHPSERRQLQTTPSWSATTRSS